MPTEPIKDHLNRNRENEEKELYAILEEFAVGIEEVVNYGTHIFKWCNDSLSGPNDKNVPTLLLFRHSLELCDAISILVRKSSIDPCKTHLRALLEALLSVLYILEKDSDKRAFAFLVCRTQSKIKLYQSLDPKTELGKQFKGKMKKTVLNNMKLTEQFNFDKMINSQKELLLKDGYREANEEFKRLKKKSRRNKTPNWYEFYDGPQGIEQLAIKMGKVAEYETLYRNWSEYVHSTDVISENLASSEGQAYVASLRKPFDAQFITSITITFAIELYIEMINRYVPNNITHYRIWYLENVKDFYLAVSSKNRIISKG